MTWAEAMLAAFLATVGRGRWWLVALASFLVRGGLLVLLPAILILPTPAELALHLDPALTGDAPGAVTPELLELVVRLIAGLAIGLVVTTGIGVRLEGELVRAAAADEELEPLATVVRVPLARAVAARLLAHVPTLVAVVVGGAALGAAAYAELVTPSSSDDLAARVVARAPGATAAIVVVWLVCEAWGGSSVRRLAAGDSLDRSLVRGLALVIRPSGLATLGLSSVAVGLPALVLWLAASRAYERLWPLVVDRVDGGIVLIALGLLVATWGAGLWLLGVALAFRSAAWTAEALRAP